MTLMPVLPVGELRMHTLIRPAIDGMVELAAVADRAVGSWIHDQESIAASTSEPER